MLDNNTVVNLSNKSWELLLKIRKDLENHEISMNNLREYENMMNKINEIICRGIE